MIGSRKIGSEPKAVLSSGHSSGIVRRAADGHNGSRASPGLIREARFSEADGVVEIGEKTSRVRNEIDRGALMCDDGMAVNCEFVLLGFAAEDGMIFEDQAFGAGARLAKKKRGCC